MTYPKVSNYKRSCGSIKLTERKRGFSLRIEDGVGSIALENPFLARGGRPSVTVLFNVTNEPYFADIYDLLLANQLYVDGILFQFTSADELYRLLKENYENEKCKLLRAKARSVLGCENS